MKRSSVSILKFSALSLASFSMILAFFQPVSAFAVASRETYASGRKYMQEEKWQKALEALESLENAYPLLSDYVLWDLATCYEKSGAWEKRGGVLRKIISGHKDSPLYRKAFEKLMEIDKNGDTAIALADCDLYLREFPADSKALWNKSCLLEKSGRKEEALTLRREILLTGSSYALNAYEALKTANCRPSYGEIKKALSRLLDKGNYGQVVSMAEGDHLEDEEGRYLLARAHFRLRHYNRTIKALTGNSYPEGKRLLAMSLLRTEGKEPFYKLFDGFIQQGPRDLYTLYLMVVDLKQREGNFQEVGSLLQSMRGFYPEKKEEISWLQAWLAIRQKRFGEADKILTGLISGPAKNRDKYLFWLGKVKVYQGLNGEALFSQIQDKNGYYWFKAGAKMTAGSLGKGGGGQAVKAAPVPVLPQEANQKLLRIAELISLKMLVDARTEARLLIGTLRDQDNPALVRLLTDMEDYPGLIKLGGKGNDLFLSYPFAFRETVLKCAKENNFDPFLIVAIMREESRFHHDAVSVAGALGVMQLMPATARNLGRLESNRELLEVRKNIWFGTTHLSKLLSQFKEVPYAVAAYNAGSRNVKKWLAAANYQDEDEFIEDIPFGETKAYVLRVIRTYSIMKALYGKETVVEKTPPDRAS